MKIRELMNILLSVLIDITIPTVIFGVLLTITLLLVNQCQS